MKKPALLITSLLILLISHIAQAQASRHYNLKNKLAIEGYDPVSYITNNKATKGSKQFALSYEGATYYFANETNKSLFAKSPQKYAPQYGGWCAYAMGDSGEKVEIDPETFKILGNKLYLFYNAWGTNTLPKWNKNEAALKAKADKNWAVILNK